MKVMLKPKQTEMTAQTHITQTSKCHGLKRSKCTKVNQLDTEVENCMFITLCSWIPIFLRSGQGLYYVEFVQYMKQASKNGRCDLCLYGLSYIFLIAVMTNTDSKQLCIINLVWAQKSICFTYNLAKLFFLHITHISGLSQLNTDPAEMKKNLHEHN